MIQDKSMYIYQYIKILNVWLSVCVWRKWEVRRAGTTRSSTVMMRPLNLFVLCACASYQTDTLKEQLLKQMQLGRSSWSRRNWGTLRSDHVSLVLARDTTAQGCWCVRVGDSTRLTQMWWRRWDHRSITKRTVVRCAILYKHEQKWELLQLLYCEELQVLDCSRRQSGIGRLDYWAGLLDWNSVTSLTCSMPCLGVLPIA